MIFYRIEETLTECTASELSCLDVPYVAILKPDEYEHVKNKFDMKIDMDLDLQKVFYTKAVVNYDALTGTLNIPDHITFSGKKFQLVFVLDEKGIVLIDADDYTENTVRAIQGKRKWKYPSLERFIYDFLEETIKDDLDLLERIESDLFRIEDQIMKGNIEKYPIQLNDIRYDLIDMHTHYEHMVDLAKELEENENEFFNEENLRYFHLLAERVMRLQDTVSELKEYIVELRTLVSDQLSIKQNNIMTLLTVITTIFMPLTLIAGWYGMNFKYMPELEWHYGYLTVFIVSVMIVVVSLIWFRKRKWL